jgi:hypothetical protein
MLAGYMGAWAFFSHKTAPVSAFIRIAPLAETSTFSAAALNKHGKRRMSRNFIDLKIFFTVPQVGENEYVEPQDRKISDKIQGGIFKLLFKISTKVIDIKKIVNTLDNPIPRQLDLN